MKHQSVRQSNKRLNMQTGLDQKHGYARSGRRGSRRRVRRLFATIDEMDKHFKSIQSYSSGNELGTNTKTELGNNNL